MLNTADLAKAFENPVSVVQDKVDTFVSSAEDLEVDPANFDAYFEQMEALFSETLHGVEEAIIANMTSALTTYINGLSDGTGDGLMVPFTEAQVKPFITALRAYGNSTVLPDADEVQARWDVAWAALFIKPVTFTLTTPPIIANPLSITKLSSIATPKDVPQASQVVGVTYTDSKAWAQALAEEFEDALVSCDTVITHLISSPTGPIAGPIITTLPLQ
jgi:hypothetical protein